MSKEAMTLALEALENVEHISGSTDWFDDCVAAALTLKEALAKQEPDYKALWKQMCERCDELDAKLVKQDQDYPFGVYGAEDLDRAWKSGYDNCKAQSLWTLEDVKKAWKSGYAAAKQERDEHVIDKSAAIRIATALGWTPPKQEQGKPVAKQRPFTKQQRDSICMIYDIATGSTTINSLQHIAKIANQLLTEDVYAQPKQEQGESVAWPMEHQPDGSITPVDPADMTPEQLQLYTTPQQPVIDKSAAIRIATALGWTPPKQDHGERCIWRQTDDINMPGTWEADCGAMWTFTEGGPKDNDMNFCPNCGKPVIEADHDVKE